MRARRPQHGLAGAVGDRGVQAAKALTQRRQVQENLRHFHRVQGNRVQDCQRTQVVIDELPPPPLPTWKRRPCLVRGREGLFSAGS